MVGERRRTRPYSEQPLATPGCCGHEEKVSNRHYVFMGDGTDEGLPTKVCSLLGRAGTRTGLLVLITTVFHRGGAKPGGWIYRRPNKACLKALSRHVIRDVVTIHQGGEEAIIMKRKRERWQNAEQYHRHGDWLWIIAR